MNGHGVGRLPRRVLWAYGLPALPAAVLGLPLLVYLPTFYAETLGLGFAGVGAVLLFTRLCDVATDPLIGHLSDRTRTRLGRRRPWLIGSLPITLVAVWFLFLPPQDAGIVHLLAWTGLTYLGWTMMSIPHQAWGAELTDDYAERNRVMAAREGCGVAGVILAVALPAILPLLGYPSPDPGDALAAIAWLTIALLPIAGLVMLLVVPEPPRVDGPPLDWRTGWNLIATNAPFRRILASYFLNSIANGLPSTLFLLFVGHVLALPDRAGLFLLVYFAAGIAGVPMWVALARRLGKHRAWTTAMAITCIAFAGAPLLGPGDLWPFLAICLATGLCFGADLALPPSMQADVVDIDTAGGGPQRTGLFFALWAMATKLALALAVGVAFPLLALLGFSAGADGAPQGVLALAVLYGLLPIAFKVAAIATMRTYTLDAAAQAGLRARIAGRGCPKRPPESRSAA